MKAFSSKKYQQLLQNPVLARTKVLLPWISLVWGMVSFSLMNLGFENVWKLAIFFSVLLVAVLLKISLQFKILLYQSSLQYVLFFSVPFLYAKGDFYFLALVCGVAASTLWDPWFEKLFTFYPYLFFSYFLGLFLGVAFLLYALDFVKVLHLQILFLGVFLVFLFFVFRKGKTKALVFCALISTLCAVVFLGRGFPILSVWLSSSSKLTFQTLEANSQYALCCETPIIAPRGSKIQLAHEWLWKGSLLEKIPLSTIVGQDKYGFHTRSCKSNFPFDKFESNNLKHLSCRVVANGEYFVGSVKYSQSPEVPPRP
jgi:hypothetical protein